MDFKHLEGIIPALVTPLDKSGENLDVQGLDNLVEFLIEKEVNGLFIAGSTGEGILFDLSMRKQIAERVLSKVQSRIPVLVHVGSHRPADVVELAIHAEGVGADGIAVIPPFYYGIDESALREFFSSVAEAVPNLPIYLYNIPQNTKNAVSVELFTDLAETYQNIIGYKDSCMNFTNFYELTQSAKPHHVLLTGNDAQILPSLVVGGSGAVSGGASSIPEPFVNMYKAFKQGDLEEAKKWQAVCSEIKKMFVKYPIANHKKVLELRGLINGTVHKPLRQVTEKETEELKRKLEEFGYLTLV